MSNSVLRLRVSFKGRPLKSYSFTSDTVLVGRDPDADVFLDNTGVSREHARIVQTDGTWTLEDLGSANGTFCNEVQVSNSRLNDNDVIRVGKFTLWVTIAADQRDQKSESPRAVDPEMLQGTTVLTNDQLARVLDTMRQAETEAPQLELVTSDRRIEAREEPEVSQYSGRFVLLMAIGCTLAGALLGAGWTAYFLR